MPNPVVDAMIAKTFAELAAPENPEPRSRISTTSNGYIHLIAWANASLLRTLVHRFTDPLPKTNYRLKHQIDDAARSVVANIEEGFARPTTAEYLTFLGYSEASLVEVKGDIQRSREDNLLPSVYGSSLASVGISLAYWHEALKTSIISRPANEPKVLQTPLNPSKGLYRNLEESKKNQNNSISYKSPQSPLNSPRNIPFSFGYPPVDHLEAQTLTYEIFIELVNKTAWHLRRLVISLEDKLNRDQKFYQVEKARVRSNLKFPR